MSENLTEIDLEVAKATREQADFLLNELKRRNPTAEYPAILLDKTYSAIYEVHCATKKALRK